MAGLRNMVSGSAGLFRVVVLLDFSIFFWFLLPLCERSFGIGCRGPGIHALVFESFTSGLWT